MSKMGSSAAGVLAPDGQFGPLTISAVIDFQRRHGVPTSGSIDPPTWAAMSRRGDFAITDIVDLMYNEILQLLGGEQGVRRWIGPRLAELNPTMTPTQIEVAAQQYVRRVIHESNYNGGFFRRMQALGGDPIAVRNPHQAFRDIFAGLAARARRSKTVLVRFQGHGGPHGQGIAGSVEGMRRLTVQEVGRRSLQANWGEPSPGDHPGLIAQIRRNLVPWAAIEMHGCHVGGRRVGGGFVRSDVNVSEFANFFVLPVTASPESQLWSGGSQSRAADYRLEGRWVSTTPLGGNFRLWFDRMSRP
jgi:hypothetical protein